MYIKSKSQQDPTKYVDSYLYEYSRCKPLPRRFAHPLRQFAHHLLRLLNAFKATDESTYQEIDRYDPKEWGEYGFTTDFDFTPHPKLGYYESLLWGYMSLNLIIADPDRIRPLINPTNLRHSPNGYLPLPLTCMLGYDDGCHPAYFCRHLGQAFDGKKLKPTTPEVLKILRDHAAMMFRCMYTVTGENQLLDEKLLSEMVFEFFEWELPQGSTEIETRAQ